MKYRKLRIAWSVAWGVVAVLLVVLWVRSYWWIDRLSAPCGFHQTVFFASYEGRTYTHAYNDPDDAVWMPVGWSRQSIAIPVHLHTNDPKPRFDFETGFKHFIVVSPHFIVVSPHFIVVSPHCVLVLCCVAAVFVPLIRQLRWRYNVRTLLIGTTLVAVVLGLMAWAAR